MNTSVIGNVSTSAAGVKKAADIVAALAPPSTTPGTGAMVPHKSVTESVKAIAPGAVGAVGGYLAWKSHRILGALAGHAIGANAMELASGDKKKALCNMAVEFAGIVGSLKSPKHRVLGYVGGAVAGLVATYFVPGSPSRDAYDKWRGK